MRLRRSHDDGQHRGIAQLQERGIEFAQRIRRAQAAEHDAALRVEQGGRVGGQQQRPTTGRLLFDRLIDTVNGGRKRQRQRFIRADRGWCDHAGRCRVYLERHAAQAADPRAAGQQRRSWTGLSQDRRPVFPLDQTGEPVGRPIGRQALLIPTAQLLVGGLDRVT